MSCGLQSLLKKISIVCLFSFLLAACGSGGSSESAAPRVNESNAGYSATAVHTSAVASSSQCPNGGIEIHTGVDVDRSGLLEQEEVTNTQELCHMDTELVLAKVEDLLPDSACNHGGHKLTIGYDQNSDNEIELEEINQTLLLCNQNPFENLAIAVFSDFEEPEGENCVYGGSGRSVGIDKNLNGMLDQDEITSSQYQCQTNYEISLQPLYGYDYCSAFYCDDSSQNYQYLFVKGLDESRAIGRVFDDGVGEVTISANEGAPSWLEFSLSEPSYDYDYNVYYNDNFSSNRPASYYILINQENIPEDAVGQVFNITLTIKDGVSSVDIEKELKVVAPIEVSFESSSLEFTESGDGLSQISFVKVNFSQPLPSSSVAPNSYYNSHQAYLSRYRITEDEDQPIYSNQYSDFTYSWLSTDFFKGQTQATLMITVKDDSLPEATENYRLQLGFPDKISEELFFINGSLDISINDDEKDVPIVASVTLAQTTVTEGSPDDESDATVSASFTLTVINPRNTDNLDVSTSEDGLTVLPFTVNFEPAIPENGSLILSLKRLGSEQTVTSDLGFDCGGSNFSNYYCDNSMTITLLQGATSYTGTIEIIRDSNKEIDESYVLALAANSSFVVENVATQFTIIDDDEAPAIGFDKITMDTYYQSRLIYVPIKLDNSTSTNVVLSVSGTEGDTAEEGFHYDFAVSQPISISPGKTTFDLPIILYGIEFDENQIEMNLSINVDSGATANPDAETIKIVLDKIKPYSAQFSSFSPPFSNSDNDWLIDKETLFMDEANFVYLTGEVKNGYALDGFESAGSDDVFISKFDLEGAHIWSQQFGTASYDSPNFQFDAKSGTAFHTRGTTLTRVTSDGVVSSIVHTGLHGDLQVKLDDAQNLYVLSSSSYSYSQNDQDGDGYTSNMTLAKYNVEDELQWVVDDFTDIQAAHTQVSLAYLKLELNAVGKPFLLATTRYSSSLLGLPSLGGTDRVSFSFLPETGAVDSYRRFGTNADGQGLINVTAYKADQLLGYYLAPYNSNLGDITIGSSSRVVEIIFNADGSIQSEKLMDNTIASTSLGKIFRSFDESYFYELSGYSLGGLFKLNENLELVADGVNGLISSYSSASQEPILSSDGGYYYVTKERIYKLTPNLNVR